MPIILIVIIIYILLDWINLNLFILVNLNVIIWIYSQLHLLIIKITLTVVVIWCRLFIDLFIWKCFFLTFVLDVFLLFKQKIIINYQTIIAHNISWVSMDSCPSSVVGWSGQRSIWFDRETRCTAQPVNGKKIVSKSSRWQPRIVRRTYFTLLGEGVFGDGLKSQLNVDAFLGRHLKVWDVVLWLTPLLRPLSRYLQEDNTII